MLLACRVGKPGSRNDRGLYRRYAAARPSHADQPANIPQAGEAAPSTGHGERGYGRTLRSASGNSCCAAGNASGPVGGRSGRADTDGFGWAISRRTDRP
jgi:hypothetical protein